MVLGRLSTWLGLDPTADWPPFDGKTPAIDLERKAFGPLKLGDALASARTLGRPSSRKGRGAMSILAYEAGGFELEFVAGKLACVAFDTCILDVERANPKAAAAAVSVGGLKLSGTTTPQDVRAWFGEPTSESGEGDLLWLDYERAGATLALEFDATGLAYVQLYAEGYA